jgi:hypothetical protein
MHTLLYTLQDHDHGHLRIIAENWGFDLPLESSYSAAKWLATAMLNPEDILEIIESLPEIARKALDDLLRQGGRAPYTDMAYRYGVIREMGAGRRDRTKPWRNPISPLEILWYRALVARTLADTTSGPREFIFIPSDLSQHLPAPISTSDDIPGEEAVTPNHIQLASPAAVEDATTLLASLRREPLRSKDLEPNRRMDLIPFLHQPQSLDLILCLLEGLELLTTHPLQPRLEATRDFLETTREKTSARLLLAWRDSVKWNDLMQVDGIDFKGDKWPNDPLTSRYAVLNFLRMIPGDKWWEIDSFVQAIHQHYPSYLRPAGDFDSWYFQDAETGMFLRGSEHWERIDGALIRHIITGPMVLLGAVDLGLIGSGHPPHSFRLTPNARALFDPDFQYEHFESTSSISVFLDGTILASISSRPSHRYQIARFCDWLELSQSGYRYRLSPSALQRAAEQGLSPLQVKSILERAGESPLPPSILDALSRWEAKGLEAYIEKTIVLRVKEAQVLEKLQSNAATSRYLHERLGPTTVVVQERDLEKLYSAAARLGILIDPISSH